MAGSLGAAVVGAGIAATAIILANKDNRKKINKTIKSVTDEGKTKWKEIKGTGETKIEELKDKINTQKDQAKKEMQAKAKK
jgi:ribosome recycling factor